LHESNPQGTQLKNVTVSFSRKIRKQILDSSKLRGVLFKLRTNAKAHSISTKRFTMLHLPIHFKAWHPIRASFRMKFLGSTCACLNCWSILSSSCASLTKSDKRVCGPAIQHQPQPDSERSFANYREEQDRHDFRFGTHSVAINNHFSSNEVCQTGAAQPHIKFILQVRRIVPSSCSR